MDLSSMAAGLHLKTLVALSFRIAGRLRLEYGDKVLKSPISHHV